MSFGINKATYSCLFASWIAFCQNAIFIPIMGVNSQRMLLPFKKYFPCTRIFIDCYEIECQKSSGLINSIVSSRYKSRNTWKVLVGYTLSSLVSFVSEAWGDG